jgi:hypothetical protein
MTIALLLIDAEANQSKIAMPVYISVALLKRLAAVAIGCTATLVAGVFVALEVILGEISTSAFAWVVISAVTLSVFTQAVSGTQLAFSVSTYEFRDQMELILVLQRGRESIIPHEKTVLESGYLLIFVAEGEARDQVIQLCLAREDGVSFAAGFSL